MRGHPEIKLALRGGTRGFSIRCGGLGDPEMSGVVNSVAYAGGRRVADVELEDISEVLKEPDRFVWIGLHEPGEELLRQVQQEFGLHDLAIEDAHRAHQRPKLERYGDSFFIVLRTAQRDRERRRIAYIRFKRGGWL